jgi:hypothetical protein
MPLRCRETMKRARSGGNAGSAETAEMRGGAALFPWRAAQAMRA